MGLTGTTNYNVGSGTGRIKYIVLHYTANGGDTAYNNTENILKELNMTKKELDTLIDSKAKKIADAQISAYHAVQNKKPVNAWAKEAWAKAVAAGVVDGTMPRAPLTRKQYAVTLDRLGQLK